MLVKPSHASYYFHRIHSVMLVNGCQAIRREGFRKRRAALGLPPGDTDPYFDTMNDDEWQVSLHVLQFSCPRHAACLHLVDFYTLICSELRQHSEWHRPLMLECDDS